MVHELEAIHPDIFISTCNWFKAVSGDVYFTDMGDHAGEMETSVMMHLVPNLIRPLGEAGDGHWKRFRIKGIKEGWPWAERQWTKVTKDTGVGEPKDSTAEKGKLYLEAVTQKISTFYEGLCNADNDDLYE